MPSAKRELALEAAYDIVSEEGLEGLHARSVAARIGVNHAAVHYYFKKRSDLLLALADFALAKFARDREAVLEDAGSDRLKAHSQQVRAYCRSDSGFVAVWASLFVASLTDEDLKAELVRHLREWSFTLKVELKNAKGSNPLSDPETLVATMLGIMVCAHTLGEDFDYRGKLKAILKSIG